MLRVRWRLDYVLLAALFLSATSCSSNAPLAGPSSSTTPASGGATIVGTFAGALSASGIHPTAVSPSITVTVQGTGISATVGPGGSFTLNVPTGDVVLQFSGAVNGQFTIPAVQNQEQIRISVSVSGTSLTIRITERTGPANGRAQVEGSVIGLNPTARTLVVDGVTVNVPTNAVIRQGDKTLMFSDLMMREHVRAIGTFSGSTLVAAEVDVQGGTSENDRS